jgi:hypothetical protein
VRLQGSQAVADVYVPKVAFTYGSIWPNFHCARISLEKEDGWSSYHLKPSIVNPADASSAR